jgi:hypothetical protein
MSNGWPLYTVKPVYNDHLWDLKDMVVLQRVVFKKISGKNKLQAGHFGYRLAVVERWLLFGSGC